MSNGYTITDTGLLVPTATTNAEDTSDMQPMRWTPDARLETDPHGIPPVPTTDTEGGVGPINQGKQDSEDTTDNRVLGKLRDWRRSTRRNRQDGLTRKVWRTRADSAEQRELAEVEAKSVIRQRARNQQSAALEDLAEDPAAEAYSNRRTRKLFLGMAFAGITLGVGISSTTAQQTITQVMGWPGDSLAGLAAYGADPALGLVLFAVLGVRALAASREITLPDNVVQAFNRIELVLFSLVALLNVGPSIGAMLGHLLAGIGGVLPLLPGTAAALGMVPHDVMVLVIHSLGPVLVACGVWGIPYTLTVFGQITAATNAKRRKQEPVTASASSLVDRRMTVDEKWRTDFDRAVELIEAGTMPTDPSGAKVLEHLGGDAGKKAPLRDALKGFRPTA